MPLRSRISPRTEGMRTVTSERLAIFLVQYGPRATCSHQSFAHEHAEAAEHEQIARKKMRHSTLAPRSGKSKHRGHDQRFGPVRTGCGS